MINIFLKNYLIVDKFNLLKKYIIKSEIRKEK